MLPPERAVFRIVVDNGRWEQKETAVATTIAAAREVEDVLRQKSRDQTLEYWSRNALRNEYHQPRATQEVPYPEHVHKAFVYFTMHVPKFNRLAALIAELMAIKHVRSEGVDWVLTEQTQDAQRSKLRAQAAVNARQKAGEYAAALGYHDIWAFEAHEQSAITRTANRKGGIERGDVETTSSNMAEEGWEDASEEAFQYSPEDVSMTQTVQVKFLGYA